MIVPLLNEHGAHGPFACRPLPRTRWGEMLLTLLKTLDRARLWWIVGWYYNLRRARMVKRIDETRWVVQQVLADSSQRASLGN